MASMKEKNQEAFTPFAFFPFKEIDDFRKPFQSER